MAISSTRSFSGKILLRVPREIHEELAHEAFKSGSSINRICMEALLARRALKNYDPWKAIEKIWKQNRKASTPQVSQDVRQAISEVRRGD